MHNYKTTPTTIRRKSIIVAVTLVILLMVKFNSIEARKCYICGGDGLLTIESMLENNGDNIDDTDTNKNNTSLIKSSSVQPPRLPPPSCDEFDKNLNNQREKYINECPSNYNGCLTQTDGETVIRSCEIYAINDCQTANGIKYCYCNVDLCNNAPINLSKTKKNSHTEYDDDDDDGDADRNGRDDYDNVDSYSGDRPIEEGDIVNTTPTELDLLFTTTTTKMEVNITKTSINHTTFNNNNNNHNETSRTINPVKTNHSIKIQNGCSINSINYLIIYGVLFICNLGSL